MQAKIAFLNMRNEVANIDSWIADAVEVHIKHVNPAVTKQHLIRSVTVHARIDRPQRSGKVRCKLGMEPGGERLVLRHVAGLHERVAVHEHALRPRLGGREIFAAKPESVEAGVDDLASFLREPDISQVPARARSKDQRLVELVGDLVTGPQRAEGKFHQSDG